MKNLTLATMTEEQKEEILNFLSMAYRADRDLLKFTEAAPMRGEWKNFMEKRVEFKACYNNAFAFMSRFAYQHPNARYVLGYGMSVIPVEHAWVQVDGVHYDPTWEKFSEIAGVYVEVVSLTGTELWNLIERNDMTPPSLFDLARLGYFK